MHPLVVIVAAIAVLSVAQAVLELRRIRAWNAEVARWQGDLDRWVEERVATLVDLELRARDARPAGDR